ncbi:hypothetical protein HHI36_021492 [Cryptolaemus montrouzieri]|uniref:Elongator complex protein 5 n=1 Tax=Cryptolaemus montrouzieri TaxID=559131 RepID=A0ABD2MX23_9CUCU
MLNTYLQTSPPTKFILIQDCLQEKAHPILNLLKNHHHKLNHDLSYFIFEGNYLKINATLSSQNIKCHNFTSPSSIEALEKDLRTKLKPNSVIILDSLVHLIYLYGLKGTYEMLNNFMKEIKDGQQIIGILHTDLLENCDKVSQCMEHLSSLSIMLDPLVSRVYYTYKKVGGRVFKQIEEYRIEGGQFVTEALKKPDVHKLVQDKINEISPELLTTFKIGLTDTEKESRDSLVLPYLPKDKDATTVEGGEIFYKFDEVDDWDEEDPDDDLDI